jgi:hypothetical protein
MNHSDDADLNDYSHLYGDIQPDDELDDGDDNIFADTMSVNRPESKQPAIDTNQKHSPLDKSSTPANRFPIVRLWQNIFSKPAMLVG